MERVIHPEKSQLRCMPDVHLFALQFGSGLLFRPEISGSQGVGSMEAAVP